jgi:hypothetical protein
MSDTTTPAQGPEEYIESLGEPRRSEVRQLDQLIRDAAPDLEPYLESGMLGYGRYHYRYASGREGDAARISVASRKGGISLYVNAVDGERYLAESYRDRLPRADIGKSCVRIKRLEDVDLDVLRELVREGATATTPGG